MKGDATAAGLNFVWRCFAVRARPVVEKRFFFPACLESDATVVHERARAEDMFKSVGMCSWKVLETCLLV